MSEAKHTAGPWVLCYDGQIDGASGKTVLRFDWSTFKEFNDRPYEERANARLIAASPCLLTALTTALGALSAIESDRFDIDMDAVSMAASSARAAIAKATGDPA